MIVGVQGLGLIGGSFAKAYSEKGHTVYAENRNKRILEFAMISGTVDAPLTKDNISECDLVLLCATPEAVMEYIDEIAPYVGPKPIVIDCCGTKRVVAEKCMETAKLNGFTYVGGHPMAGTQYAGFKNSLTDMFVGAPMVIVPPVFDDIELLEKIKELLKPAGFGTISVTTAEDHDRMIAFTSQLAHIVSSAYIKSPTAGSHKGFSAGSYQDLTRVAALNPDMWTELFLENKDNILFEINTILDHITEYRDAIANNDPAKLRDLLEEGRRRKVEVDG